MTEIVFAPRLATQTSRPSGVTSMPSAPFPVSTFCTTLPAARSITVTPPPASEET